jgi:glycerol-3-phosphate dehydrogenase (NAD(P)+)
MADIFILGCGFGLALAVLWKNAGHNVTVYSNDPQELAQIQKDREHKRLLPGITVPDGIKFTSDIKAVNPGEASPAGIIVFAVPSKFVGQAAEEIAPFVHKDAVVVNVGKGFCDSDTHCRLSDVISLYISNPIVILTGPCHAEEVGRGVPTTVVCAGKDKPGTVGGGSPAEYIQQTLQTPTFRVYMNDDIVGCELGGALKNPIALCCGIAVGMGLGDNSIAAIMTRGLAEIKRLGTALGANWQTFTGLAGVGDLIVTCTSLHSRNNRAGQLIGKGATAAEAIASVGTVEGYECVKTALKLAHEHNVDVPIFEQLYKVCYEGVSPRDALKCLMERPQRHEQEAFW